MKTEYIEELSQALRDDQASPHQKYPDQALYALSDNSVAKSISQRFETGAILADIKTLGYDFYTGLNRIYFEFTSSGRLIKRPDAILVLMDADCKVIGTVDPFNPIQPSRLVGELPQNPADLPFVLSQPTASDSLHFTEEDMKDGQEQATQFFIALLPSGLTMLPGDIGLGPGGLGILCAANETTSQGRCSTGQMVCKQVTGIFAPHCDGWGIEDRPDEVADDCGVGLF